MPVDAPFFTTCASKVKRDSVQLNSTITPLRKLHNQRAKQRFFKKVFSRQLLIKCYGGQPECVKALQVQLTTQSFIHMMSWSWDFDFEFLHSSLVLFGFIFVLTGSLQLQDSCVKIDFLLYFQSLSPGVSLPLSDHLKPL